MVKYVYWIFPPPQTVCQGSGTCHCHTQHSHTVVLFPLHPVGWSQSFFAVAAGCCMIRSDQIKVKYKCSVCSLQIILECRVILSLHLSIWSQRYLQSLSGLSLVWSLSPTVSQARLYQISCGFPAQRLRWNHHTTTCWARSVPAAQLSSRNILDRSNLMKGYWMITSPSDGVRVSVWDPPASLPPVCPARLLPAGSPWSRASAAPAPWRSASRQTIRVHISQESSYFHRALYCQAWSAPRVKAKLKVSSRSGWMYEQLTRLASEHFLDKIKHFIVWRPE